MLNNSQISNFASYSEDEVTTLSVNPRLPMPTGTPRRWRSTLVTVWSVTAGMRTSLFARSSGSSNSAIPGYVLRKYNNNNSNNNNNNNNNYK